MIPFACYTFVVNSLSCHGFEPFCAHDRSTVYRWRISGYVPDSVFYSCLFQLCYCVPSIPLDSHIVYLESLGLPPPAVTTLRFLAP